MESGSIPSAFLFRCDFRTVQIKKIKIRRFFFAGKKIMITFALAFAMAG